MKCQNCGAENNNNAKYCINCGKNLITTDWPQPQKKRNPILILGLTILIILIAIGSLTSYIIFFDTSPIEITVLNNKNSGNILENTQIANNLINTQTSEEIIEQSKHGTPLYKIGDDDGPVTVITAGVHGDQLNPSIAAMHLIDFLENRKIKGTVYILPFVSPEAISQNTKLTNGINLNEVADEPGTISYDIVEFSKEKKATAVGDFHETQIGKNPGETTIMCTQIPNKNSYQLAENMSILSKDHTLTYLVAGIEYEGAIEDELNLKGVTAVTPLVQVPTHGKVYESSVKESFTQMLALLYANGNLDADDTYLKLANMDIDGF